MNRDQIKGKLEKLKGDVKQRFGGASKDRKTQAEGWVEEKKGEIRSGVGDVEEKLDEKQPRREPDEIP